MDNENVFVEIYLGKRNNSLNTSDIRFGKLVYKLLAFLKNAEL
jgi:hypothetical protein